MENTDGFEIINLTENKRSYRFTSLEDRRRIIECARRGDDLKEVAKHLGLKIKTCRAIAATDREKTLKPGIPRTKFTDEHTKYLCELVDDNPGLSLRQLKAYMENAFPGNTISKSSIDRLLDGHHYTLKKMTIQPMERNTLSTKAKRADYATWLQQTGCSMLRLYIDETNYNIWCCRSFGRSKVATPCVNRLPSSKGPNLNILACCSSGGILKYQCHSKITWHVFNEFLIDCSLQVADEQPGMEAVFIFDNAPIHRRAAEASLCSHHHIKCLSPYSPMFNPLEEAFSKFKKVCLDFNYRLYIYIYMCV